MNDDLRRRLWDNIGMGENPKKRSALFRKLMRLEEQYGDVVVLDVAECWLFAKEEADQYEPGRLFCRSIIKRLTDRGIWKEKSRVEGLTAKEALAKAFPDEEFPLLGETAKPAKPLATGEPVDMADSMRARAEEFRRRRDQNEKGKL